MKFILSLIFIFTVSFSETLEIDKEHIENAKHIERVLNSMDLKEAPKYLETLVMISFQESHLGKKNIGDFKKGNKLKTASLGMFHMRIVTVRELQRFFPKKLSWLSNLSDKSIANLLLRSKGFGIILAAYNLERIAIKSKGNYKKLVSQWNGGFNNTPYYNAVIKHKTNAKYALSGVTYVSGKETKAL